MPVLRSVRVQAVIERPPKPPWIGELPFPARAEWWPGSMLDWRWIDRDARTWTALVRYHRDGLLYEHWVNGELIERFDVMDEEAAPTPQD